MEMLITYDVDTTTRTGARRLKRVAAICEGYGLRVQQSVFEVVCTPADWVSLRHQLDDVIDHTHDSIRAYTLTKGTLDATVHLGRSRPAGHHAPFVF